MSDTPQIDNVMACIGDLDKLSAIDARNAIRALAEIAGDFERAFRRAVTDEHKQQIQLSDRFYSDQWALVAEHLALLCSMRHDTSRSVEDFFNAELWENIRERAILKYRGQP